jgi:hypothetical protein
VAVVKPQPEHVGRKDWINLPAEILLIVAELLPTSLAAAMTISCKLVYAKLGTKFLEEISADIPPPPFKQYLQTIDRRPEFTPAQKNEKYSWHS